MAFRTILGQERALRVLRKALTSTRLAHAYLFYGPPGVGKRTIALQFVQALYCSTAAVDECGTCPTCRKISAGHHPDVMYVQTEGTTMKIEQVRAVQRHLGFKPYENQRTTVILDGCEFLTPPAANALLKTLEEPPSHALLLLLTGNKDALPLTINSRCQMVPFCLLTPAHVRTLLERQRVPAATASLAASLVGGSLDRFTEADFTQRLTVRQNALHILQDVIQTQGTMSFLQARKLASKRDQCEEVFQWLTLLCRDLTMLRASANVSLYNQDLHAELTALIRQVSLNALLEAFDLLQQLTRYLRMNLNPQLLFEQLLVQLPRILAVAPPSPPPPQASRSSGKRYARRGT